MGAYSDALEEASKPGEKQRAPLWLSPLSPLPTTKNVDLPGLVALYSPAMPAKRCLLLICTLSPHLKTSKSDR